MSGPWHWRMAAGISGVFSSVFMTDLFMVVMIRMVHAVAPEIAMAPSFLSAAERAIAFLIGLTGMLACQTLLAAVERVRVRAPGLVDQKIDELERK